MTIYDSMIEAYHPQTPVQLLNARHEVMQQIVLAGLDRGGFFMEAPVCASSITCNGFRKIWIFPCWNSGTTFT